MRIYEFGKSECKLECGEVLIFRNVQKTKSRRPKKQTDEAPACGSLTASKRFARVLTRRNYSGAEDTTSHGPLTDNGNVEFRAEYSRVTEPKCRPKECDSTTDLKTELNP